MDLKFKIEAYKRKRLLTENKRYKEIAERYLERARNNLVAMQIDYKVSKDEDVKNVLNIADFKEYNWVVVKGYYSMYMAVLACLAKLSLKSDNHNASICSLEFYFVKKGMLEKEYLEMLRNVSLENHFVDSLKNHFVDSLKNAKETKIVAQYDVLEEFEKRKAEEIMNDSRKFVDRLGRLFYEIKEGKKMKNKKEEIRVKANKLFAGIIRIILVLISALFLYGQNSNESLQLELNNLTQYLSEQNYSWLVNYFLIKFKYVNYYTIK